MKTKQQLRDELEAILEPYMFDSSIAVEAAQAIIDHLTPVMDEVVEAYKELQRFYDGKGSYDGAVEKLNMNRAVGKISCWRGV